MELLVLWTVTGGIARHLQSLLSSIASSYANKENTARSFRAPQYIAIKRWLQLRTSNMSAELRSLEWQFLRNITSTQSRGAAIPSTPILESLLTKNVEVAPLYTDLYQVDVASYTVNNSYIRAIARSLTMLHQAPKQLVMDLCDFGLKDFVEKLLTDCRRQAESNGEEADNDDDDTDDDEDCQSHNTPQWAPDPRILAAARLMSLSYDDFDIDLVLQKEETRRGVHLLFGSFKLNEKEMSPPSIKAFCDKNVTKFLTTKIPDGIKVLSVHIIGLAVGIRMDNCSVRENWMKSAKQLEATISIPCSGDLWSFDDMIRPLRTIDVDDSPFPLADATSLRNAWSTVDRREDAADAVEILQGGGSIIVRGYAGVGKTTIFKEIVMPALESRGDVHYIDGFQLVSDQ
ncbi:hypothetical protein DFJ77DRAFT_477720 [Powellomyces hirtus]|nr:hypothetical protein DFJ77DRAFT_477720 [Powellomyces hirtus]